MRLEVSMCPQRLDYVPDSPELGVQLDRLEVVDVVPVEEHVSDRGCLFVDFEWMASEDYALGDDAGGVGGEEGSHCDQAWD